MKKIFVAGLLLLFILFSCTQYVFVPFPGGGDSGDDWPVEKPSISETIKNFALIDIVDMMTGYTKVPETITITDGASSLSTSNVSLYALDTPITKIADINGYLIDGYRLTGTMVVSFDGNGTDVTGFTATIDIRATGDDTLSIVGTDVEGFVTAKVDGDDLKGVAPAAFSFGSTIKVNGETVSANGTEGTGTVNNPFEFSTNTELVAFANAVNKGDEEASVAYVLLTDDIELFGEWTPIGNVNRDLSLEEGAFKGVFDGDGHTVSGLSIDAEGENGVGYAFISGIYGENAVVRNLTVTGSVNLSNLEANGSLVVGFVGGGASVENCIAGSDRDSSSVTSTTAGGVVSRMIGHGKIVDCVNYATIKGGFTEKDKVGGIVSTSYKPDGGELIIKDCINYGDVSGSRYTGGVVGFTDGNTISGCRNEGNVSGSLNIGGVVGQLGVDSSITESDNYGNIVVIETDGSGLYDFGGIVGYALDGTEDNSISITHCENHGQISVGALSDSTKRIYSIGGILGCADAINIVIEDCINSAEGTIEIPDNEIPGTNLNSGIVGGIAGTLNSAGSRIENCINYADISGATYVAGILGSGSDDINISYCENHGDINAIRSYNGGITSKVRSGTISHCLNTGSVIVEGSSLAESQYNRGTAGGIMGSYDGSQNVIIEYCTNGVENDSEAGEIRASYHTGGIVGGSVKAGSKITDSTNYGKVTGNQFTGGIAGEIGSDSLLKNVRNYGEVITAALGDSFNSLGGIVGRIYVVPERSQNAEIDTALSMGAVTVEYTSSNSSFSVGGIAGSVYNHAVIKDADSSSEITGQQGINRIGGIVGTAGADSAGLHISFTDCEFSGRVPENGKTILGYISEKSKQFVDFENCISETAGDTGLWN